MPFFVEDLFWYQCSCHFMSLKVKCLIPQRIFGSLGLEVCVQLNYYYTIQCIILKEINTN